MPLKKGGKSKKVISKNISESKAGKSKMKKHKMMYNHKGYSAMK